MLYKGVIAEVALPLDVVGADDMDAGWSETVAIRALAVYTVIKSTATQVLSVMRDPKAKNEKTENSHHCKNSASPHRRQSRDLLQHERRAAEQSAWDARLHGLHTIGHVDE